MRMSSEEIQAILGSWTDGAYLRRVLKPFIVGMRRLAECEINRNCFMFDLLPGAHIFVDAKFKNAILSLHGFGAPYLQSCVKGKLSQERFSLFFRRNMVKDVCDQFIKLKRDHETDYAFLGKSQEEIINWCNSNFSFVHDMIHSSNMGAFPKYPVLHNGKAVYNHSHYLINKVTLPNLLCHLRERDYNNSQLEQAANSFNHCQSFPESCLFSGENWETDLFALLEQFKGTLLFFAAISFAVQYLLPAKKLDSFLLGQTRLMRYSVQFTIRIIVNLILATVILQNKNILLSTLLSVFVANLSCKQFDEVNAEAASVQNHR